MSEKFFQIGETRIKVSNIKNYGISEEVPDEAKTFIGRIASNFEVEKNPTTLWGHFKKGAMEGLAPPTKRHLYITTYQNDNFRFDSKEHDIEQKIKELDALA
ncbi:hypothetical protein [Salinicola sp. CPA57]|uniref:hypothetical protein n=1 Tax=Salinicola sp. CPA57 TaxID=1949080 RepID=UPI00130078DB|nr:hypothetical protein [Salinicola sp. CPA57]